MKPFNPKGSTCVVTGGANGIGKALCIQLAKDEAKHVVVVDIDLKEAQRVVESLPHGVGLAMRADCSLERDIRRVINRTELECGPIDIFFCNAGILSTGGLDVSTDEWEMIWKINVMQPIYVARHLMPRYEKRKRGFLVITASAAGLTSFPGALPYAVTKHAAVSVAEWLAFSYAGKGIQVSCLCPQAVKTNMLGGTDGGPAGLDGIISPTDVAKATISAIQKGVFMILPHPTVAKYFKAKANNYDRWIAGMVKMQEIFGDNLPSPELPNAKL